MRGERRKENQSYIEINIIHGKLERKIPINQERRKKDTEVRAEEREPSDEGLMVFVNLCISFLPQRLPG